MSKSVRDLVQALGNEIRDFKAQLKDNGLSATDINEHPDVQAKVAELRILKAQLDKDDPLTDEAFMARQKLEHDQKEREKKKQIDEERQTLQSTQDAMEMPLVQRKIFHLFQFAGSGDSFHYEPPPRLNADQTGFGAGSLPCPPVFVTEKWDGTTMQATKQAIFRRLDITAKGKKRPKDPSQRYELRLVAWLAGDCWMGLDFLEADVRVVEALRPYLPAIQSLDEGLCVYFECVHQRINTTYKNLEGFAGIRVFDFARVGPSGRWDSGKFLPFDETVALSSQFGLPCVGWTKCDQLGAPEVWADLEAAVGKQYNTADAPLEGFVVREVSGDRIAKARVEHLQSKRAANHMSAAETAGTMGVVSSAAFHSDGMVVDMCSHSRMSASHLEAIGLLPPGFRHMGDAHQLSAVWC